ncbi:MAG: tetratricopeptide repeat protein [Nodosilinea sp.]
MAISLCMIVKDEASTLGQALASVKGIVDEIIVVDTGSTDGSQAIAAAHGARVYPFTWVNDFAAARNASLGYATGDWVLVLDADEVLCPAGAEVLRRLDQGDNLGNIAAETVIAVNLLRLELGAPQTPYTLITRCFRRLPEISFERPYHETVDDSVARIQTQSPGWQVVTAEDIALHHTGYAPEAVAQRGKFDRARTLMEPYLAQHPDDSYLANKLAALYIEEDRPELALPLLDRALANRAALDPLTRYELHYHRGLAHGKRHPDQAATAYQTALDQPVPPKLKLATWINYGSLKKSQGDLAGAIGLFEQAIAADPTLAIAHYNLGTAHRARGYLDEAIAAYRQAIALCPDYAEAHQNLGVALVKLGQLPAAMESFGKAVAFYRVTNPAAAESLKQGVKALNLPPFLLAQAHLE